MKRRHFIGLMVATPALGLIKIKDNYQWVDDWSKKHGGHWSYIIATTGLGVVGIATDVDSKIPRSKILQIIDDESHGINHIELFQGYLWEHPKIEQIRKSLPTKVISNILNRVRTTS